MEGDKTTSYQSGGTVKLFVGCVPSDISLAALEDHFSRYGEVQQVARLSRKKMYQGCQHMSANQSKGLGHCIITVTDWNTAEKILQSPAHTIQGRKLLVEKYLQGSARLQNVELRNQKRFFLKGIPSYMQEQQLLDWLSRKHGEIEVLHEIKPRALAPSSLKSLPLSSSHDSNSPAQQKKKLPTKIYSVQFKHLEQATKFSKSSQRYFKNNRIQVERYDFSRGNNLSASMEESMIVSHPREVSSHQVLPSVKVNRISSPRERDDWLFFCKPTQAAYYTRLVGQGMPFRESGSDSTSQKSQSYRFNLAGRRSLSG
jgi:hypothetical protein